MALLRLAVPLSLSLALSLSSALSLSLSLATAAAAAAADNDAVVSQGTLDLRFDGQTRTLRLSDREAGPILDGLYVTGAIGEKPVASNHASVKAEVLNKKEKDGSPTIVLHLPEEAKVYARLADGQTLEIESDGDFDEGVVHHALPQMGDRMIAGLLREHQLMDAHVLLTLDGPAELRTARSVYDPLRDLALAGNVQGGVWWKFKQGRWELFSPTPAVGAVLTLKVRKHYYRDELGVKYFAPLPYRDRWPVPPAMCMTWYGIEAWKGNPAQRKAWLYPNIDWVARHLGPYAAGRMVFQLDDNYPQQDDKYMREVSDYIRGKGLIPGVWLTPFVTAPPKVVQDHPGWFLHNAQGETLLGYAGLNWGWAGARKKEAPLLNVQSAEAVDQCYSKYWLKAAQVWNFDLLKIDGLADAVDGYREAKDGGGLEGFRKGLEIGRKIVGPEKYISATWGTAVEAMGPVNGCRTGPDIGNEPHTMPLVARWNYLNNVCLWCDPDATANLHKASVERARLNAILRVLTGQQLVTDDVWTEVSDDLRRVWQQSLPALDIRPANLYPIEAWNEYDMLALRIARQWGNWTVVGLMNFEGQPAEKTLDLARLPIEPGDYHIYDFYQRQYLGRFSQQGQVTRLLAAYEGQAFAVVPAVADRPVLLSTDRHLSQGALELRDVVWTEETADGKPPMWTVSGRSTHLVAGDPYELVFLPGPFRLTAAKASAPTRLAAEGNLARLVLTPKADGEVTWQATFERLGEPQVAVSTPALEVRRGEEGRVAVLNRGPKPIAFRICSTDSALSVTPAEGQLNAWPASTELLVKAVGEPLDPGQSAVRQFAVETVGGAQPPQTVDVRVYAPPVENLARKAKAAASSSWPAPHWTIRFDPKCANDHDATTRWIAGEDDAQQSWIELSWPSPVEFDRVVIDECVEAGPRIKAWRLHTRSDEGSTKLAEGKTAGRCHVVKLSKPVKTAKLRLELESSAPARLWELKVYRSP